MIAVVADYETAAVTSILLRLYVDFPELLLFRQATVEAVRLAWVMYRRRGYDDDEFFAEYLSIRGRIALAGMTMGLMQSRPYGCDAAAEEAGQRRLTDLPEGVAN